MTKEILILGAGFGGLEAATGLSTNLGPAARITLIDKKDHFYIGFSKFEVAFGRESAEQVKAYYRDLADPRVRFAQETITRIDLDHQIVQTGRATYPFDYLVIALGADLAPAATPGFVAGGHEFYSLEGAARLYSALDSFTGGTILLSILGQPYKCPPAPFEAAFQLHDFYRQKGLQDQVTIKMVIPMAQPMAVAQGGPEMVRRRFAERGIELITGQTVTALDPQTKQAHIESREPLAYDLFIGVPVHQPPPVVRDLGLSPAGWIPVSQENLSTSYPHVYAVGDVTTIPVGSGAVPKAGAFAENAAKVVVSDIVYQITGRGHPLKFEATGNCYLEFGDGEVAQINANFLGYDQPQVVLEEPSATIREEKARFKDERFQRWFGQK